jgi:hypothetical protein
VIARAVRSPLKTSPPPPFHPGQRVNAPQADFRTTKTTGDIRERLLLTEGAHAQLQPDDSRIAAVSVTAPATVLVISIVPIGPEATL